MLTYSQKKYLFAIYKLSQERTEVRSAEVAKIVGVSKASTAAMTVKLSEGGYIEKEYYGHISLTEKGIKEANDIFTKQLIINDFLHTSLKISKAKADEDSVAIVSHVSEETAMRLTDFILKGR